MQPIDDTLLTSLETLAHLRLPQEQRQQTIAQLHGIIHMFEQLSTLPLDADPPSTPVPHPLREDIAIPCPDADAILACAPQQEKNCIVVPKTVD